MRIPAMRGKSELRVNMTPMIDVVFLLIIFFLVSSHLARQESQMPLPLPTANSGEEPDLQRQRVVINLMADGRMFVAGRLIQDTELPARLSARREEVGSELEVRIRSDRAVAFHFVQPILLAVSKSGVRKVTFAVTKSGA